MLDVLPVERLLSQAHRFDITPIFRPIGKRLEHDEVLRGTSGQPNTTREIELRGAPLQLLERKARQRYIDFDACAGPKKYDTVSQGKAPGVGDARGKKLQQAIERVLLSSEAAGGKDRDRGSFGAHPNGAPPHHR